MSIQNDMSIDEAIKLLEGRYTTVSICGTYQKARAENDAIDMAIAALREKQEAEKNEPLTLDDLKIEWKSRKSEQTPYYLQFIDNKRVHACILDLNYEDGIKKLVAVWNTTPLEKDEFYCSEDTYGVRWICYRHPPKTDDLIIKKVNEPLSIPDLLKMDEQPVFISDGKEYEGWRLVDAQNKVLCGLSENDEMIYCGTDYMAYRSDKYAPSHE